mmetsp:Transcript_33300/g.87641  ORF Transcript_33300/g.87641 Transcript_33300/m.87641 type:complete len:94 (+) Transcript_33300:28-309(+)|eukprot:CAMPEP_0115855732 /NCGR_PEP_ID=MMETSP0287-20121206/14693_1 /TAXON_ID=412157 /ORGANISM="Chrysochromulina rotalis, Strain UIO044" /LENGTH=93 /DNA_ID=CAMNT_0003309893 /DNA_START=25 /DNA_END=306 /DNA_ORIENTATION=+
MDEPIQELMAEEPDEAEASASWAKDAAKKLGIVLMRSESGDYKNIKKTGPADRPFVVHVKEGMFVTKVMQGSYRSGEAASLALALHEQSRSKK